MTVNLTDDSVGKTFYFEHYNDGDGRKILLTDILIAFYIDELGTVVMFESIIPRDTQGAAATSFGGFVVGSGDSLTPVEEE